MCHMTSLLWSNHFLKFASAFHIYVSFSINIQPRFTILGPNIDHGVKWVGWGWGFGLHVNISINKVSTLTFCPTPLFTSEMADVANKIVKMQFEKCFKWELTELLTSYKYNVWSKSMSTSFPIIYSEFNWICMIMAKLSLV